MSSLVSGKLFAFNWYTRIAREIRNIVKKLLCLTLLTISNQKENKNQI